MHNIFHFRGDREDGSYFQMDVNYIGPTDWPHVVAIAMIVTGFAWIVLAMLDMLPEFLKLSNYL